MFTNDKTLIADEEEGGQCIVFPDHHGLKNSKNYMKNRISSKNSCVVARCQTRGGRGETGVWCLVGGNVIIVIPDR